LGIDIYMLNYTAYSNTRTRSPRIRRNGRNPNRKQPHVLADSGGFQLFSGVKEFIDPLDIVTWYNDNVDWGMVLDVPPIVNDLKYKLRSAEIQARNNEIMLKNKCDNLELVNVVQGHTFEERIKFLDIVDNPDINRLAFPGYRGSIVSGVADVLRLLTHKRKFKHYHVLGVYNPTKLLPIIKAANITGNKALVTSDASTAIQGAANKVYHHQQGIYEPAKGLIIGNKGLIPSVNAILPCSCPVCSVIKYINVLGFLDTQLISNFLALHNIYELGRYTSMMDELARTVDDKEYYSVVKHQLKGRSPDTLAALDMISLFQKDKSKALNDYSIYFTKTSGGLFSDSLFATEADIKERAEADKNLFIVKGGDVETSEQKLARQLRVLKGYEDLHGIVHKKKNKEKKHGSNKLKGKASKKEKGSGTKTKGHVK